MREIAILRQLSLDLLLLGTPIAAKLTARHNPCPASGFWVPHVWRLQLPTEEPPRKSFASNSKLILFLSAKNKCFWRRALGSDPGTANEGRGLTVHFRTAMSIIGQFLKAQIHCQRAHLLSFVVLRRWLVSGHQSAIKNNDDLIEPRTAPAENHGSCRCPSRRF